MKVTLTTPYVSTNAMYTVSRINGRKILTTKARLLKKAMSDEAEEQVKNKKPMSGPLSVIINWYVPDLRRRDFDNLKMVIDSLTGICWVDDSNIWVAHIYKILDKENPRFEIIVHK